MDYREGGTPRNTKETKNIDSQLGIQLIYDWRAFKPHEYIAHPAIHNTGAILTKRGIRPRFEPFERVGERELSYVDFQQIPRGIFIPPEESAVIVNFHQPVSVTETTHTRVHISHDTETRGKYLPWRKKTLVTTTEEEREERAIIGPLTSTDLLADAGSPEPVIVSEMIIVLPDDFFREIQKSVLHDAKIGNRLSALFFMKQSKDEQVKQMPVSEQVAFFTKLLKDLLSERNADPAKIDEFSEWIQRASVLRYDFDENTLTPIT